MGRGLGRIFTPGPLSSLLETGKRSASAPSLAERGPSDAGRSAERKARYVRRPVQIGARALAGFLLLPENPRGLVICAFGAGSSHESPRNIQAAEGVAGHGFATLLFDLLDEIEALDQSNVFDIGKLAGRLVEAVAWAEQDEALHHLPTGIFGAGTGTAAALVAAVERPDRIDAIASRRGRPDLAEDAFSLVDIPIVLLVNKHDARFIRYNQVAIGNLICEAELRFIDDAQNIFSSDEFFKATIDLASEWFKTKM